ncbi:unnamed protein product [Lupinus luteus]|uniref:Uncharacterized protein n=1 Tax=Lupinus luteus TaxID=3873 RepID=A0AAV1XI70_LUPLU
MIEKSRDRFLGVTIVGRGSHTPRNGLIYYIWDDGIPLVAPTKYYLCNRLVFLRGYGMVYSYVNPSFSFLVSVFLYSLVFFIMLVHTTPTSLLLKRSFLNHGMNLTAIREIDMQRHGSIVTSTSYSTQARRYYIKRQNCCL